MTDTHDDRDRTASYFEFVPREFTLKALICWIFQSKNGVITRNDIANSPMLGDVGMAFLKTLNPAVESFGNLSIRVFQNLTQNDVLVLINERHAHVIDFDTGEGHSRSPLARGQRVLIRNEPSRWLNSLSIPDDHVHLHYMTTGNLALCEEFELIDSGFRVTNRIALHQILSQDLHRNVIVQAFRQHLYDVERDTQGFRAWAKGSVYSPRSVEGFLRYIETGFLDRVALSEWRLLVSSDGAWGGLRWTDIELQEIEIWVEPHRISIRSWIVPKDALGQNTLDSSGDWSRLLSKYSFGGLRPPCETDAKSKPVCVSEWNQWIHFNAHGLIDLGETLRNLSRAYEAFRKFLQQRARN